ncbi:FAD-dependent oxidoreductase [Amycolatopsis anabasis]|uniref:FAD-dependent oxidoreductase n=1 Tax=Amycolatopsis anabasis TaxID=1840409 RepID=UPI00131A9122|nr:FAD-dependent oxidoreductase [Amycolatopsis anabasis]
MRNATVPLVIIGAGPYGLALSAQCRQAGVDHLVFGRPMSFWSEQMPSGMLLRSTCDWHLDPLETYTLERYAADHGLGPGELDPIPLPRYLDYAAWFQEKRGLVTDPRLVSRLDLVSARPGRFRLALDDGTELEARQVVVATGMGACAHIPDELAERLPAGSFAHTSACADLTALSGKSCLIVGGRQSAFEWAALAAEAGAAEVHVSHRHATPRFAPADWTWVTPLLDRFEADPGWYRELTGAERDEITHRMWRIGRMQLEAWLAPRLDRPAVRLWPESRVRSAHRTPGGAVRVELDTGTTLTADRILLATGYRMDVRRLPFLTAGSALGGVEVADGFPVLDEFFRSTVPGLYFTSRFAVRDFGHFFDFTAAARISARMITEAVRANSS